MALLRQINRLNRVKNTSGYEKCMLRDCIGTADVLYLAVLTLWYSRRYSYTHLRSLKRLARVVGQQKSISSQSMHWSILLRWKIMQPVISIRYNFLEKILAKLRACSNFTNRTMTMLAVNFIKAGVLLVATLELKSIFTYSSLLCSV